MQYGLKQNTVMQSQHRDALLIGSVILLSGIGLVILYSATFAYAELFFSNQYYFLFRQSFFFVVGFIIFLIVAFFNLDYVRPHVLSIMLFAMIIQVLPFVPGIGAEINGANRWIHMFNITTLQPSEFLKPALIVYLASFLDKKKERIDDFFNTIVPSFLVMASSATLLLLQSDFSSTVLLVFGALVIFWVGGVSLRYFVMVGTIVVPIGVLFVLTNEYMFERIIAFLYPAYDPEGLAYQVSSSMRAIISGGFFGKGIGLGTLKISSIPEIQSDFTFSSYAEETGFIGVCAFLLLWFFFSYRGFKAAIHHGKNNDLFRYCIGIGAITFLLFQVIINLAVVSGSVPATGLPLPFVSAGGTNMLSSFILAGLVINISKGTSAVRKKDEIWQVS